MSVLTLILVSFLKALYQAAVLPHNMKSLKSSLAATTRNRTKRKVVKRKGDATSSEPHTENRVSNKKKQLAAQVERSIQPAQIHCISCKQTDVPLMLGGRESFGGFTMIQIYVIETSFRVLSPMRRGWLWDASLFASLPISCTYRSAQFHCRSSDRSDTDVRRNNF